MKTSRIPHPVGGRFFQIHDWAVRAVGRAGAAVLAVIDFLDRAQAVAGRPVASRARVVAELEGFIGRNAVDEALAELVSRGWLARHERTGWGGKNYVTTVEFSLCAGAIALFLGVGEEPEGSPERGPGAPQKGTPGVPDPVPEEAPDQGLPCERKETKKNNDKGEVVVSFIDGEKISVSPSSGWAPTWIEDLVTEATRAPAGVSHAKYAYGILANWRKTGQSSSDRQRQEKKLAGQAAGAAALAAAREAGDRALLSKARASQSVSPLAIRLGRARTASQEITK